MLHRFHKTVPVVHVHAVVVTKRLLIQVAEQVKRLNANVGAADSALEQAPEVFQTVCVNPAIYILSRVIYDLVREISTQAVIGKQRICIQGTFSSDVSLDMPLHILLVAIRNVSEANLPAALQDSHNGCLVFESACGNASTSLVRVHVSRFSADKGFASTSIPGDRPAWKTNGPASQGECGA